MIWCGDVMWTGGRGGVERHGDAVGGDGACCVEQSDEGLWLCCVKEVECGLCSK